MNDITPTPGMWDAVHWLLVIGADVIEHDDVSICMDLLAVGAETGCATTGLPADRAGARVHRPFHGRRGT